ncbi:GHMP kinase [Bradyrhizobium manausense]|uniref:GHMP family kinase ATP-binding protein n=1 Tax=Bradyrhizobium manausense TaxID=989370 RepID=UPI001BA82EF1|nr:GHMP kinase [Bradyrhizobium manausense]MBR1092279.1 GHMP kinase [Bradyrhizobium manausense]
MIISRTPLRMSFVGGGSDIPAFYREYGGAVLSTAIDKYVYVNINRKFDGGIRLAYSKTEEVDDRAKIEHRLVRATFELLDIAGGLEITTIADIPSRGTGLGSSSSFTVGLINAISAYIGRYVSPAELGEQSCKVEIELCGEPIGKQDQYAAAFGGFNLIRFNPDESVQVSPVIMRHELRAQLQRNILLFYTGITRSASSILQSQSDAMKSDRIKRETQQRMVQLTFELQRELQAGNLENFGAILDENWRLKKSLATDISNQNIDDWYECARKAGARGGKILGAGSGGFLLFYAEEEHHLAIEKALQLRRVNFSFEPLGSQIIFYNPTST